jgi:hypothetical protein
MPEMRRVPVDPKRVNPIPDLGISARGSDEPQPCDCPHLEAEDWDEVENDWSDIAFLKGATNAVLGLPVGYHSLTTELREKAVSLGLAIPDDPMVLLGEGKFRRALLLEVEAPPDVTRNIYRPGGIAFTRLAPGPPGKVGKLMEETRALARERYGKSPDAEWIWYLTCRECSAPREYETLVVLHYRQHK